MPTSPEPERLQLRPGDLGPHPAHSRQDGPLSWPALRTVIRPAGLDWAGRLGGLGIDPPRVRTETETVNGPPRGPAGRSGLSTELACWPKLHHQGSAISSRRASYALHALLSLHHQDPVVS
jgi:hypothetical protein